MPKRPLKKPELAAPAGNWSSLESALRAGCDSVYFGVKGLSMRNFADNFDVLQMRKVLKALHGQKKKGHLALNVFIHDREVSKVRTILKEAKKAGVDGVILWDAAVLELAKDLGLRIHISTQASVSNFGAFRFYARCGARRIVLARECSLADIKRLILAKHAARIPCETEAFIHGAMCLSVSGRCFLSSYTFSKSANRGECIQPCRRQYLITDLESRIQYRAEQNALLSPKDLCTVDFIDMLIDAGIDAFKIEGRMRPSEYVGVVTSVYRRAIDAHAAGRLDAAMKEDLKQELATVFNRGFSSGFYFGVPDAEPSSRLENSHEKIFVGEICKYYKKIGVAEVLVRKNTLRKGDNILCVGPVTPASFATVDGIQIDHCFVEGLIAGQKAGVRLPFTVRRGDKVFLWKKKEPTGP